MESSETTSSPVSPAIPEGPALAPPPGPILPFSGTELTEALTRPHRVIDHALGRPARLARNLAEERNLGRLAAVLLVASLAYAIPFSAVPPVAGFWKIAVLFTGSVLICFPCLHVFGTYLGFRLSPASNLVVALVIPATAGLFSFGLFPIVWFIDLTTDAGASSAVTPAHIAAAFLVVCLVMGIIQVGRCLFAAREIVHRAPSFRILLTFWIALLVFITWRMAQLLELAG